ncbi:MAG: SLC13/DASS family transporter [Bacteroidetes bacterium]|nr:SLC13/DASS family transporter [Bacteroidota bacterium]MCH8524049.1 SLC13 family permease [Balneolales bacterium]
MSQNSTRSRIGLFLGPILFLITYLLPTPEGLSPEAHSVAAIAVLMAVWWVTEALPIAAVAFIPISLFPLLGVMPTGAVTAQYGNQIIYLFIGGFFIAITMERWNLHRRIALNVIRMVGTSPAMIILGFMIASAILSMFVSNTATAMMMVPIGLAVIKQAIDIVKLNNITDIDTRPENFHFAIALMLGIAYACSIGGVATILGTPPNAVFVGTVETLFDQQISYALWMYYGVPMAFVMLFICWIYLVKFAFPLRLKELPGGYEFIMAEIQKLGKISKEEIMISVVFAVVAALWIIRGFVDFGNFNDAAIAITGSLVLFMLPTNYAKGEFLLDWKTAVKIPWGIVVLFGGGLALAHGFSTTGLAAWIAQSLMFLSGYNLVILILAVALLTIMLTEVTSNTATATMMMPILASMALAMSVHPYGLMIAATIAASFAFMLPVATPPNAVVFGSSFVTIPHMARAGVWLNIIGVIVIVLLTAFLLPWLWDIDLTALPVWLEGIERLGGTP